MNINGIPEFNQFFYEESSSRLLDIPTSICDPRETFQLLLDFFFFCETKNYFEITSPNSLSLKSLLNNPDKIALYNMLILPNLILHKTRLNNHGNIGVYSILVFFPLCSFCVCLVCFSLAFFFRLARYYIVDNLANCCYLG